MKRITFVLYTFIVLLFISACSTPCDDHFSMLGKNDEVIKRGCGFDRESDMDGKTGYIFYERDVQSNQESYSIFYTLRRDRVYRTGFIEDYFDEQHARAAFEAHVSKLGLRKWKGIERSGLGNLENFRWQEKVTFLANGRSKRYDLIGDLYFMRVLILDEDRVISRIQFQLQDDYYADDSNFY
jgi:hypothetical protein